jgi:hypothetical protein
VVKAEDFVIDARIKDGAHGATLGDMIQLLDQRILGTGGGLSLLSEPLKAFPQGQDHGLGFVLARQGRHFLSKAVGLWMRNVEGHGGQRKKQVGGQFSANNFCSV